MDTLQLVRPLLQACSRLLQRVVTVVKGPGEVQQQLDEHLLLLPVTALAATPQAFLRKRECHGQQCWRALDRITGTELLHLHVLPVLRQHDTCCFYRTASLQHRLPHAIPNPLHIGVELGRHTRGSLDMWCSLGMFLLWPGDAVGSRDARQLPRSTPGAMNIAQNSTVCMRKHNGLNSWQQECIRTRVCNA